MTTQQLRNDFKQFLYHGPSIMTGRQAEMALRDAKVLATWRELEAQGKVRLVAELEQESYFDVYGEPDNEREKQELIDTLDRLGCYYVVAEYKPEHRKCCDKCGSSDCCRYEEWEQADSIGMCVYEDPIDPFENCYVIQLMQSAIDKLGEQ